MPLVLWLARTDVIATGNLRLSLVRKDVDQNWGHQLIYPSLAYPCCGPQHDWCELSGRRGGISVIYPSQCQL